MFNKLKGNKNENKDSEKKKESIQLQTTTESSIEKIEDYKEKEDAFSFYPFCHRLLSYRIKFLFPRLPIVEKRLRLAGMPVYYEAYISAMVFLSIVAGMIGLVLGTMFSISVKIDPPEFRIIFPIILGLAAWQVTFGMMYYYPTFNIKSRNAKISMELPYYVGYMATLSASGLPLEGVFKAIAKDDSKEEIVKDAKTIVRNLEILGMDIITALKDLISRTSIGPYSELMEGLVSTVESGGNLKEYCISTAKVQMEEKKLLLKKMTASLGIVAEMYTILLIVFPLLAVIMMSIMSIMTPNLGGFNLVILMQLLTYGAVPFFGLIMLVMIDSMVPKR